MKMFANYVLKIVPGPPLYSGKFDAPTGQVPAVKDTGAYTGELKVKYDAILKKLDESGERLSEFVNKAWPHYEPNKAEFKKYPAMIVEASKERKQILVDIGEVKRLADEDRKTWGKVTRRFAA
jgi:hypothetical protein